MALADNLMELTRVSQSLMDRLDSMPYEGLSGRVVNPIPFDLAETPDCLMVRAYLPGFQRDDVQVEVRDHRLAIKAERRLPERDDVTWLHVEAAYGTFLRTIGLSADVDTDHIEAAWQEGVLTIRLPKAEEARPRRIPIQASGQLSLDA
jgi:HSP20 family protein